MKSTLLTYSIYHNTGAAATLILYYYTFMYLFIQFYFVHSMADRDIPKICTLCREPYARLAEHYAHKTAPCHQIVMSQADPLATKADLVQLAATNRRAMTAGAVVQWADVQQRLWEFYDVDDSNLMHRADAESKPRQRVLQVVDVVRFVVEEVLHGVFVCGDNEETEVNFFMYKSKFQGLELFALEYPSSNFTYKLNLMGVFS